MTLLTTSWGARAALIGGLMLAAACQSGSTAVGGSDSGAAGQRGTAGAPGGGAGGSGASQGGTAGKGAGGGAGAGVGGAGGVTSTLSKTSGRDLAVKLGRPGNFLVGMGNDLNNDHNQDGAYTLGVTLDLHDAYLVGLGGLGGWPDWNAGGTFVNILTDTAAAHGVVPMFTLYAMAAQGENRTDILVNTDYMTRYWADMRLFFNRLAVFNKPAVVHIEPDFWGFMQQAANGDPTTIKALVKMVPDCSDQPETLVGLTTCLIKLGRKYAPKAALGLHASSWAGDPASIITFFNKLGAQTTDFVATDALDRDAGCYEAHTDSQCLRGGTTGWYWDETNATHPNFTDQLVWAKQIADGVGKPILWWQVPFGVPSTTPGGTTGHYRDNRVHYLFSHIQEFIDAGFVGAAFGTGAANQTYITTDNDQFKKAATSYFAKPFALP